MNARELKFRVYSFVDKQFYYFDIYNGYPQGIAGGVSEPQQYTGLKDKNGKEIYEGDILKDFDDPVMFRDGHFFVRIAYDFIECPLHELDENNIEIIGHILTNEN